MKQSGPQKSRHIVIIGGGPAGLLAAEKITAAGHAVAVYERKPSPGRKFLMAGRGGLNLTHSEPEDIFLTRYGPAQDRLSAAIGRYPPAFLRAWCEELGEPTFIGSSGRVFPKSFKASPLLRTWIARLEKAGVKIFTRHDWTGWDADGNLTLTGPGGEAKTVKADATLLALGGASWPKLGADGSWVDILQARGVTVAPLLPSNCGFVVPWSPVFRDRFAGQPLKTITVSFSGTTVPGEILITRNGIEGGAVYALSSALRNAILRNGQAVLAIDLRPALTPQALEEKLSKPRGSQSFSTWMQKSLGLSPLATSLLREADPGVTARNPHELAHLIKAVKLQPTAPFPLDRAISTAGGIKWDALTDDYMLKALPGVFAAGEMLDWEAPTGGYLLQATFATAAAAAGGLLAWLEKQH